MERLDRRAFAEKTQEYDAAVGATGAISACSSSDWILAADRHLHPGRAPLILHEAGHWLVLAFGRLPDVPVDVLAPFESYWGFGSPLVGPDPDRAIDLLEATLSGCPCPILLRGIPVPSLLYRRLGRRLGRRYRMRIARDGACCQIDLSGGVEAFLARRSRGFRTGLRQARRRTHEAGIRFEYAATHDPETVFRRILDLEGRAWKEAADRGIFQSRRMRGFYGDLFARAAAAGRLRSVFARRDGIDVAYAIGGLSGTTYRGYQMAYAEDHARIGIGNVTQLEMMERLAEEGVGLFDLGMEVEYKRRWEDRRLRLSTVLILAG